MQEYNGNIETKFYWIIPFIIGISKNTINSKSNNYSLHITPFIEISFNYLGTRNSFSDKKIETIEQMKYWMNEYHDSWIKNHNKINAIRKIAYEEKLNDLEKLNNIKEITGERKLIK